MSRIPPGINTASAISLEVPLVTSYVAIRKWFKILLGIDKQSRASLPSKEGSAGRVHDRNEIPLHRDLASDRYTVQNPLLIAVVVDCVVERRSVVPNHYVAGHPVVAVGELWLRASLK